MNLKKYYWELSNTYIANYLLEVVMYNFDLEFLDEKPPLSYSDKNLINPKDQTAYFGCFTLLFLFGLVGIYPVPLPAEYFSTFSSCLDCCVWGGLSSL